MQVEQRMLLPQGVTISSLMQPADYEKLRKYFADSLHTDITAMDNKKPMALQQIALYAFIDGETESFELYFLKQCMAQKKPIKGLETIDTQLNIFDSIPYAEQLQWLLDGIADTVNTDTLWNSLIDSYKNENLHQIAELIIQSSPEIMAYENLWLTDRNKNWIPVIETLMQENSTFIAVGAGHLPFDTGILQLLSNKGYTLKAL
ncbi:MAG: TraB/GumN family protein, partial [Chitinophagales bacterium]